MCLFSEGILEKLRLEYWFNAMGENKHFVSIHDGYKRCDESKTENFGDKPSIQNLLMIIIFGTK